MAIVKLCEFFCQGRSNVDQKIFFKKEIVFASNASRKKREWRNKKGRKRRRETETRRQLKGEREEQRKRTEIEGEKIKKKSKETKK